MNCDHKNIGLPGCAICDPDKSRVVASLRHEMRDIYDILSRAGISHGFTVAGLTEGLDSVLRVRAKAERLHRALSRLYDWLESNRTDEAEAHSIMDEVRSVLRDK